MFAGNDITAVLITIPLIFYFNKKNKAFWTGVGQIVSAVANFLPLLAFLLIPSRLLLLLLLFLILLLCVIVIPPHPLQVIVIVMFIVVLDIVVMCNCYSSSSPQGYCYCYV